MIGPNGRPEDANADEDANVAADVALTQSANFDTNQRTSVAAWDVTVRAMPVRRRTSLVASSATTSPSSPGATAGRSTARYYTVSTDGLRYSVSLGIDGNGFVVYGNSTGFLDAGSTPAQPRPLYHDVLAANEGTPAQLTDLVGGVSLARPEYPIFFEPPAPETLQALGIPLTPTLQTPSSASFAGTAGGNTSNFGTGGTFNFTVDAPGVYTMVISQDGMNFDPALPANRQVRIVANAAGPQSVRWDGFTNEGVPFPVGGPYPVRLDGHAGEYHFPMLDVENNLVGGPVVTLLNPPGGVCPPWNGGCRGAFYDDRGYISGNGTAVGTPGQVLCAGIGRVATPPFSDPVLGFDTATAQRGFGDPSGGNANVPCAAGGSFGDTKGVDLWTFYPGGQTTTALNIIANTTAVSTLASSPPGIQVGKTVTVSDTAQLTGFDRLSATAEVEFSLVGPVADPSACPSAPVVGPVRAPVNLITGRATTGPQLFTPQAPGNYYWVTRFLGDPGNLPAGPTGCGDRGRARHRGPGDPDAVDADHRDLRRRRRSARRHLGHRDAHGGRQSATRRDGDLLARRTRRRKRSVRAQRTALLGPITSDVDPATGIATTGDADVHAGGGGRLLLDRPVLGRRQQRADRPVAMSRPERARGGRQDGTDHDDRGDRHAAGPGRRFPGADERHGNPERGDRAAHWRTGHVLARRSGRSRGPVPRALVHPSSADHRAFGSGHRNRHHRSGHLHPDARR